MWRTMMTAPLAHPTALVPVLANEVEHKNTVWVLTHPATHQQPYGGALIEQLTRMMSAFK